MAETRDDSLLCTRHKTLLLPPDEYGNIIFPTSFSIHTCPGCEIERLRQQVESLRAERDELNASFDLRWKADMRAIARWREAHPGNELVMPDHADLCVWLLDERDALIISLAPLLGVKPDFCEVFIPGLNGGMAVCLACGAHDDMVMIKEHKENCTSTAQFRAHEALRSVIEVIRAAQEENKP